MQWFYSELNERQGPIGTEALQALRAQNRINAETLVWREGFADWVTFSSVEGSLTGVAPRQPGAPLVASQSEHCVECLGRFALNDLVAIDGNRVCASCKPIVLQKMREGVATGGLWRNRRQLVVGLNAPLPDRCVKCNAPSVGPRLKRDLYWHSPILYVMILFPGLLIYAIVAMCVRKRVILQVGLCEGHRSKRRQTILIAWLLIALSGVLIVAGFSLMDRAAGPIALWIGFPLFIGAMIWGIVRSRVVTPARIEAQQAFISGVCTEFLAGLPEWTKK